MAKRFNEIQGSECLAKLNFEPNQAFLSPKGLLLTSIACFIGVVTLGLIILVIFYSIAIYRIPSVFVEASTKNNGIVTKGKSLAEQEKDFLAQTPQIER